MQFCFFSLSVYVSTSMCAALYVSVLAVCDGNKKKRKNESQLKRAVCMFCRLYFTETCFFPLMQFCDIDNGGAQLR